MILAGINKLEFYRLLHGQLLPGDNESKSCPYKVTDSGVKAKCFKNRDYSLLAPSEQVELIEFETEAQLAFPCAIHELIAWAEVNGFVIDKKELEDGEIMIERFFPALCYSLSSREDALRKLDDLREKGVNFRPAEKGYFGGDWSVKRIGVAISNALKEESITADEATVQVSFDGHKSHTEDMRLCELFICRKEVKAAYQRQGIEDYPWPGYDPLDRQTVLERKIKHIMSMPANTPLELESKERQIVKTKNELAEIRCQTSSHSGSEDLAKKKVSQNEPRLNRNEGKRITVERHQLWADKVNECQRNPKNPIQGKRLTKMAEAAAKELLQINHPDNADADSFYERYFNEKKQADWKRLADAIFRSQTVKDSFKRIKC